MPQVTESASLYYTGYLFLQYLSPTFIGWDSHAAPESQLLVATRWPSTSNVWLVLCSGSIAESSKWEPWEQKSTCLMVARPSNLSEGTVQGELTVSQRKVTTRNSDASAGFKSVLGMTRTKDGTHPRRKNSELCLLITYNEEQSVSTSTCCFKNISRWIIRTLIHSHYCTRKYKKQTSSSRPATWFHRFEKLINSFIAFPLPSWAYDRSGDFIEPLKKDDDIFRAWCIPGWALALISKSTYDLPLYHDYIEISSWLLLTALP